MATNLNSIARLLRSEGLGAIFKTRLYRKYIGRLAHDAAPFEWDMASRAAQDLESKDLIGALELHRALVRVNPSSAFYYRLGRALASAGNLEDAASSLQTAVDLEPQNPIYRQSLFGIACQYFGPETALNIENNLPPMDFSEHRSLARQMAITLLASGAPQLAFHRHPEFFGQGCLGVARDGEVHGKYSVEIQVEESGFRIIIPTDFLDWPFLIDRLFIILPFIVRAFRELQRQGRIRICLGDFPDGDEPQLGFCGVSGVTRLIPDPNFLESDGYAAFRRVSDQHPRRFIKRIPKAYWRGSLTGMADDYAEIMQLPRVQLALLGRFEPCIDAKITDLSQFGPLLPTLEHILRGLDTIGTKEDNAKNLDFKYVIDIDGNTNSWPGLFTKMLTRSVVIKLSSNCQQWYYDRLIDGLNYIKIQNLREIPDVIARLEANPRQAAAIGQAAYQLASSMNCETEFKTIKAAVAEFLH